MKLPRSSENKSLLDVRGLSKKYPSFLLENISFSVMPGEIVGFIGRNGAGKSTTIKALLGLITPDSGEIRFFSEPFADYASGCGGYTDDRADSRVKNRVGFVPGGIDYYPKARLSAIIDVTRRFYSDWDDAYCCELLSKFKLDTRKTPSELSAGMKVKFALTLALSHKAELLILDEPTSGLDPISRDELLDILLELRERSVGIFFSTHIIGDLERCADRILHIGSGRLQADSTLAEFVAGWRLLRYSEPPVGFEIIGERREREGFSGLIRVKPDSDAAKLPGEPASLEEIMLHLERNM